jgi:hypothetical protein
MPRISPPALRAAIGTATALRPLPAASRPAARQASRRGFRLAAAALLAVTLAPACPAIEMFTFFGDGSRIGLPSLEVPIEAYPGIPLRSDRIRARRRAMRMGPNSAVQVGPGTPIGGGITIRAMPTDRMPPLVEPTPESGPEPIVAPEPVPTAGRPAAD